ncbi:hypothetical protein BDV59DRAFT_28531 [Aspergillus ambiguus]|uniref:putative DNA mismatch repair protein n=1 Tax=Aspergillus ambiguus TaxID=176160 RepID=UPI003CCD792D
MPITALPQDTARAIGSASVISDPCSVVKELLDNALDASAVSVFIEISQNTVDVIQVKDNGHGISPGDHAAVCKRAHTSKIQTVEDLRKIGGSSLGFRGEALASTVEVSGSVNITTRIEAEPVGSVIKYGRDGGVISVGRASHPVGTTVRVTDLFKHVPVRRQTTLRNATKTLTRIKQLVQEYAAAQPSRRLSLKILKAKNESGNWVYAPKPGATIVDAAMKIAGSDVASTCVLKHWPLPETASQSSVPQVESELRITGLLLDPAADVTKGSKIGQHISVDGRPISTSRGLGKNIAKIYKSYLRSSENTKSSSIAVTDPFLCVHIQCDGALYDVNIEPAKDDVLFEDPPGVLSLIEGLFRHVYGDKEDPIEKRSRSTKGKEPVKQRDGFELLLSRSSPQTVLGDYRTCPSSHGAGRTHTTTSTPESTPDTSQRNMQVVPDVPCSGNANNSDSTDQEALNPWSITKIIAPFNPLKRTPTIAHNSWLPISTKSMSIKDSGSSQKGRRGSSDTSWAASPTASNHRSMSTSPSNPQSSGTILNTSQTSPSPRANDLRHALRERDRARYGNGSLDTWFSKTTQVALTRIASEDSPSSEQEEPSLARLAQDRFGSENQLSPSQSTPVRAPSCTDDISPRTVDTPLSKESQHSPPAEVQNRPKPGWKRLDQWSSKLHELSKPTPSPGLAEALDFENRKKEAIQKRREQIKNREGYTTPTSSPHLSRYLAARAALSEDQTGKEEPTTTLNPYDPRAYLLRHQTHESDVTQGEKPRRINTNKLPFEKIPDGQQLHNIGLTLARDISAFSTSFEQTSTIDLYTKCGYQYEPLTASNTEPGTIDAWSSRLSRLINMQYRTGEGAVTPDVHFDFSSIH